MPDNRNNNPGAMDDRMVMTKIIPTSPKLIAPCGIKCRLEEVGRAAGLIIGKFVFNTEEFQNLA